MEFVWNIKTWRKKKHEEEMKVRYEATPTVYDIYFAWKIENSNPKNIQSKFMHKNILAVVKSFRRNMRAFIIGSALKYLIHKSKHRQRRIYLPLSHWKRSRKRYEFPFQLFFFLFFLFRRYRCLPCGSSEEKILKRTKMMSLTKVFWFFVQWFIASHWVEFYSKEVTVRKEKN